MRNRNTDLIQTVHGVTFPFVGVAQIPQVHLKQQLRTRDANGRPVFSEKSADQINSGSILTKATGKVL